MTSLRLLRPSRHYAFHIITDTLALANVRGRYKSRRPDKRMLQASGFGAIRQTHEYLRPTVAKLQHFFSYYFNPLWQGAILTKNFHISICKTPLHAIDAHLVTSKVSVDGFLQPRREGTMDETYCVLYRDSHSRHPASRLSMAYMSLDLAINAAFHIAEKHFEPIEIRGSDGTIVKTSDLMKAIAVCAG
jgi:hypothetical protein